MSAQIIYRCLVPTFALLLRDLVLVGALAAPARARTSFYHYRFLPNHPVPVRVVSPRKMSGPENRAKEIIGKDDRQTTNSGKQYPWTAIGRVFPGNCTATLVGEDLLLTNAHCVLDYEQKGKNFQEITFHPNVVNGQTRETADVARVTEAITGTDFTESISYRRQYPGWQGISLGDSAQDWALLKLDKPVGLKYGFWNWRAIPTAALVKDHKNKLAIAGYPQDFKHPELLQSQGNTLAVQEGCSILKEELNMYQHDCDTAKGSSGSPIFYRSGGNLLMVALNNASNGQQNFAVNLRDLPETFRSSGLLSQRPGQISSQPPAGDAPRTTTAPP
jgi:V8-like Glu-specific endopeptidase